MKMEKQQYARRLGRLPNIFFILAERENHEVFSFVEESPFLTLVFQSSVE